MTDERRAYTRLGQRARAKERASRARAHTLRISRAQLPCLVAQQLCWVSAASGPWASCRSAHYTVSFVAGQRLPRGAHKALTGYKRKKQRVQVGIDRSARNGVSARRVGRPAEGRGRCTTPRTPGGLSFLGGEVAACCVDLARPRAWPATFDSTPLTRSIPRLLISRHSDPGRMAFAPPIWHSRIPKRDRASPTPSAQAPVQQSPLKFRGGAVRDVDQG